MYMKILVEYKRGIKGLIGKLFVGKFLRCLQIGSTVQINSTKEKFYTLHVKTNSHPILFEVNLPTKIVAREK